MLGKLFKHEFKTSAKLLIPLNLIVIGITLIGCLLFRSGLLQTLHVEFLNAVFLFLYIISLFALFILTAVYLTMRFYKTMYSSQGYLTHTLPVSSASILNTKILTSVFWVLLALIITACSIWFLIRSASGVTISPEEFRILQERFFNEMGIEIGSFLSTIAGTVTVSCFTSVLMIFASLSVGQLFRQYRIPAAIGACIVFYFIQQIASVILLLLLGINAMEHASSAAQGDFTKLLLGSVTAEALLFAVAYYILCYYFTKKKLNLE